VEREDRHFDAFSCYDFKVEALCKQVDRAWSLNPDLDSDVQKTEETAVAA